MRAPDFWQTDNAMARFLEPFGQMVGAVTTRRATTTGLRVAAPVICIGNLTVGGTGKTPVTASIVRLLAQRGRRPAVLLRGYGGNAKGPLKVDPKSHDADAVGDEALLHARDTATWVARVRAEAAPRAIADGADVLVMDDGHQHASLAKDLSLVVVDGRAGFGNGRILPAGPLRESVAAGLARADAVVLMGEDVHGLTEGLARALPVLRARLMPRADGLRGQRVVAFAGIGDPLKFYRSLVELGAEIAAFHPFDDHYAFETADIQPILDEAYAIGALPVTTEKDAVRLAPDQRQQVNVVAVDVAWEDEAALTQLIDSGLAGR